MSYSAFSEIPCCCEFEAANFPMRWKMLRVFLFCFIIFDVAIQSVIDVLIKFYVNECAT